MKGTCNDCGAPLPPEAPEGLCPRCLMRVALGSQSPATCPEQAPNQTPALNQQSPAPLPDPAKLAQYFPQLEILELLGQGGMGAVYKARQPALDRLVALKILPRQAAGDPGFAERFNREARALAKLNHPNIVAVHDFGQVNGLNYLVMEYVDGPNLRQLEQAGKLTARQALQIIPQICEALQFAHDEGVVHRDIKPENVLLDRKGRVKIADFGLAKILGREAKDWRLTGARDVMGTPHYMAPEQVEHPQQVDHRADIYSLGVVFYEMLTGELPLGKFAPPSQKVQVDVRLDDVVLHALEKEPSRRYQMASQVKTDLDTISTGTEATLASKTAERSQSNLSFRPRPEAWKVAFGTLAATAILLLLAWGGLRVVGMAHDPASLPASAHSPVPPVVVKTVPESGAANVDPALTELRVTFSKPMKDGSWSWSTWGEENFPETIGAIHYLPDARTCVLPVKLKPGKVYATWINSEQFQNFQDAEGQPAFPYLLIFETKTNNGSAPPGPPRPSD